MLPALPCNSLYTSDSSSDKAIIKWGPETCTLKVYEQKLISFFFSLLSPTSHNLPSFSLQCSLQSFSLCPVAAASVSLGSSLCGTLRESPKSRTRAHLVGFMMKTNLSPLNSCVWTTCHRGCQSLQGYLLLWVGAAGLGKKSSARLFSMVKLSMSSCLGGPSLPTFQRLAWLISFGKLQAPSGGWDTEIQIV